MKVLVAKNSLPTGTIFQKPEEVLEIREIAKATAPKNVLATFEEVRGRQLKIPRQAGHTITEDDLYSDKGNDLMALLPPGHRAVGIRVSAETVAAGFVALPHSRILMHQPSGSMQGQAADIAIQAEQIIYLKRMMAERIAFHTGQPLERIETDSDRDRWFTAEEACEYGFIDKVIDRSTATATATAGNK